MEIFRIETEPRPPHLGRGIVISLLAYLFFIAASTLVRYVPSSIPTIQVLWMQNVVGLVMILPIATRKGLSYLKTECFNVHMMRDLFGVLSYYLYFLAIHSLTLIDATTLNYTAPFFVPLVWWIWMKQKISIHLWWSIIIGFIGVACILNPSRQIFQQGFVYGLFAGISSAVALCAVRVVNLKKEPMSRTLFYYFSVGTVLSFPFAWVNWSSPSQVAWIQMILIGALIAIGQIFLTIAYRYGTASYLSPLGYSSVIYAGLCSWFIFGDPFTWKTVLGMGLIITGGTITYILKTKPTTILETFTSPQSKERPPL